MEQYIYNKSNGLWYEWQGDYYIPCLTVQTDEEKPIGLWGRRHLQYIKQERKLQYMELLTSGRLNSYLADINATGYTCLGIESAPYEKKGLFGRK